VLVEHGADVNAQGNHKSRWTPLHLASRGGHVGFARVLIDNGTDVNAKDDDNSTPLHLASSGGHVEFAQVLVENRADVNALDNNKSNPLHLALKGGHVEFAQVLVENRADVMPRTVTSRTRCISRRRADMRYFLRCSSKMVRM
jgi:ankyrin repeat protein